MMEICPKEQCASCYACLNACPTTSIVLQEDEWGCLYPVINQTSCIDCGLCQKVCPVCQPPTLHSCKESYIAYAANHREQQTAASGGLAAVLSRHVVRHGGVVYGASAVDAFNVQHVRVDKEADLEQLKGSKYVHSKIGVLIKTLKEDLQAGRDVLFVGTPCQVAGVRGFLRKDYPNFFALDLVCHGVPPQKVLNSAIAYYCGDETSRVKSVRFRRKEEGQHSIYGLYCDDAGGQLVYGDDHPQQHYALGFMAAMFYRPNCHTCPYACPDRVGDITLGDFWDRDGKATLPAQKADGISMLIVNTERGKKLMADVRNEIVCVEHPYTDFTRRNGQLTHPMRRHASSENFWKSFVAGGFAATESILAKHEKLVRKNILKKKIKRAIYTIPFLEKLLLMIFHKS